MSAENIITRLAAEASAHQQAAVLAEVISASYENLVKVSDFSELKGIVAELAQAQKELAQIQQRTELRVEDLARVQPRTEHALLKLQKRGGLSESIGGRHRGYRHAGRSAKL